MTTSPSVHRLALTRLMLVTALLTVMCGARAFAEDAAAKPAADEGLTPAKLLRLDQWFAQANAKPDPAAADAADAIEGKTWDQELWESLVEGRVVLDIRLRMELAKQDHLDSSAAYTSRIRLGYGTKPWNGFSGFVEMEDIRAADEDGYNAAGTNGEPHKTVIADVPDTELNQAYLKYSKDGIEVIAGRQRITLDDHRFIGNVGWRQNEQTYDSASVKLSVIKDWTFYYAYLWEVNRIFGPDADRDFDSSSHIVNVSYAGLGKIAKISGFAYLLDFDNAAASSSNTYGFRVNGSHDCTEDLNVGYIFSYAYQTDAGDNPTSYNANYVNGELFVTPKGWGTFGAGYELLGTDDQVAAFSTPLATLHKFNGWADVFLATPKRGLQDLYIYYNQTLPWEIKGAVVYHWFWTDENGGDLGEEIDAQLSKSLNKYATVITKVAFFDGDDGYADIVRFWLELNIKF